MSDTEPTAREQFMLELVNRARRDPEGEAARFGIDLNTGLPAGTIDATLKQPLAMNAILIDSSRAHSQWMLDNDVFSHTGDDGSSSHDRMVGAGFQFTGSWRSGENLSWTGTTGTLDADGVIAGQHEGLFRSPGHRENLMQGDFREVGIGILTGEFTSNDTDFNASMATQNFAKSGSLSFLTGVFYDDTDGDNFYTIGEGVGGVRVTAEGVAGNFSTTSYDAGGYSLALPDGNYDITLEGPGIETAVVTEIRIDGENVRVAYDTLDERLEAPGIAEASSVIELGGSDGEDIIEGTNAAELIHARGADDFISAGGGNDTVFAGAGADEINAGNGADSINGGDGLDLARFEGDATDFIITRNSGELVVSGPQGTDTLSEIERLVFDDRTLGFDDSVASLARLYQATFGREPDAGGLGYWLGRLESGRLDMKEIAERFVASEEFRTRVGEDLSNEEYILALYPNVFGREADEGGLNFWSGILDRGNQDRVDVLLRLTDSPENVSRTADLTDAGLWFT